MSAVKKKKKPKFGKSSWSMIDVAESLDDLPPKPGSLSARSDSMPLSAFPSTAGSDATSSALSREQSQAEESIERGLETLLKADKRSKEKERAEKGAAAIRAAKKSKTRGAKERVKESPSRRRRAASPKKKAKLKKKGSGGDDRIGNDVRSIVRRKLKRKGMEGTVADMFLSSLDYFPDKDSLRESVAGKSKKKPTKVVDIERVWEMAEPFSRKTQDGKDDREEDGDKDKDEDEEEEDILERAKRKGKKKRRGRIPLDPSTASHQWTGRRAQVAKVRAKNAKKYARDDDREHCVFMTLAEPKGDGELGDGEEDGMKDMNSLTKFLIRQETAMMKREQAVDLVVKRLKNLEKQKNPILAREKQHWEDVKDSFFERLEEHDKIKEKKRKEVEKRWKYPFKQTHRLVYDKVTESVREEEIRTPTWREIRSEFLDRQERVIEEMRATRAEAEAGHALGPEYTFHPKIYHNPDYAPTESFEVRNARWLENRQKRFAASVAGHEHMQDGAESAFGYERSAYSDFESKMDGGW